MNKIKTADKTVCHFIKIEGVNKLHSWEGAAFIPNGDKSKAEYYLFGIKMSKDEWQIKKDDMKL